jgi:hypothetical protein
MRHLVIPDTQCKPGGDFRHLRWAGEYAAEKKPDVIIHIGDHWDFPSLSSYDKGLKSFEGRRYLADVAAGNLGMTAFMEPILREQQRLKDNKKAQWNPRLVFTVGNHENRIARAINLDAILEGMMGLEHTNLEGYGWEVIPFLEVVVIDGIAYSHYFTSGVMGRPVSNARLMLQKKFMSCVMGHVQDRDIAFATKADGTRMTGIFAGIFYQHDEEYLNPQTNRSWRGIWMLNEVNNGQFDELPVSMEYLRNRYEA